MTDGIKGAAHWEYEEDGNSGECTIVSDGPIAPNDEDIAAVHAALKRRVFARETALSFDVGGFTVTIKPWTGAKDGIVPLRLALVALEAIHGTTISP